MGYCVPPPPPAVLRRQFEQAIYGDMPTWECAYCGSLHPAKTAIPVNKCCNCGAPRQRNMDNPDTIYVPDPNRYNHFIPIGTTTYPCWL